MKTGEVLVLDEGELGQVQLLVDSGFNESTARILVALESNGETPLADLDRITGVKPSTVSLVVTKLAQQHIVVKERRLNELNVQERPFMMVRLAAPLAEVAEKFIASRSTQAFNKFRTARNELDSYRSMAGMARNIKVGKEAQANGQ